MMVMRIRVILRANFAILKQKNGRNSLKSLSNNTVSVPDVQGDVGVKIGSKTINKIKKYKPNRI